MNDYYLCCYYTELYRVHFVVYVVHVKLHLQTCLRLMLSFEVLRFLRLCGIKGQTFIDILPVLCSSPGVRIA